MTYKSLGLAALLVSAIRSAVADPAEQEQIDAQQAQIDSVRSAFDGLNGRLEALSSAVSENGTLDADQAADLDGIKGELAQLADALTGPADDTSDNGVIAEVEQIDPDATSPTADAIVESAPAAEAEAPAAEGEQDQGQQAE